MHTDREVKTSDPRNCLSKMGSDTIGFFTHFPLKAFYRIINLSQCERTVIPEWGYIPFWNDPMVFNKKRAASVIADAILTVTLRVKGP